MTAAHELVSVAARALRPSEKVGVAEWCDRHRVMPEVGSARPGRWETAFTPYLAGPMQAFNDPSVREIVFRAASQVGKTEFLIGCILWAVANDPGPTLVMMPTADLAESLNRDRFVPGVLATGPTADALRSESPRDMRASQVDFDRCSVWFVGSNSTANAKSRPVRYVVCDEIDDAEFERASIALVEQRVKAFARHKVLKASTPGLAGDGIDAAYAASDRRVYQVPCPACGHYHELRWQSVRWNGGRMADPMTAEREAWMVCPACSGRIGNADKPGMLAKGLWVGDGQRVENGLVVGERRRVDVAGFTVSSLYSPTLTFGRTVRAFLEADARPTPAWVNGWLGEGWQESGERIEEQDLVRLKVPPKAGGYLIVEPVGADGRGGGTLPDRVLCLAGFIDLQRDRAYVEVRGFGERGDDSYLVWHGSVACPMSDDRAMERLDALTRRTYRHADGTPIPVAVWGVDSGHGERTHEVYAWALARQNVWACKGRWSATMDRPHETKYLEIDRPEGTGAAERSRRFGAIVGRRVRFLGINSGHWKDVVLHRIARALAAKDPGGVAAASTAVAEPRTVAESEAARGGRVVEPFGLPADCGDEYLRQLASEQKVVRTAGGRSVLAWVLRPGVKDNHYLDTCAGVHAVADAMGVTRVTAEAARAARATARQQQGAANGAERAGGAAAQAERQGERQIERQSERTGGWVGEWSGQ